jgi:hypothetical protein
MPSTQNAVNNHENGDTGCLTRWVHRDQANRRRQRWRRFGIHDHIQASSGEVVIALKSLAPVPRYVKGVDPVLDALPSATT